MMVFRPLYHFTTKSYITTKDFKLDDLITFPSSTNKELKIIYICIINKKKTRGKVLSFPLFSIRKAGLQLFYHSPSVFRCVRGAYTIHTREMPPLVVPITVNLGTEYDVAVGIIVDDLIEFIPGRSWYAALHLFDIVIVVAAALPPKFFHLLSTDHVEKIFFGGKAFLPKDSPKRVFWGFVNTVLRPLSVCVEVDMISWLQHQVGVISPIFSE